MASKRAVRRKQCDGKVRFTCERNARKSAEDRSIATGTWIGCYHCNFCNGWHIGHVPGYVKKAIKQRRESK